MAPEQPKDDPSTNQSLKQKTSYTSDGNHVQSNGSAQASNGQGKKRLRTKLIVAGIVLLVVALIGSAINATVAVCRKGQERFDDDNHPIRMMYDSALSSFTAAGKDKDMLDANWQLMMAEKARVDRDYVKAHACFERVRDLYHSCIPGSYTFATVLARIGHFEYQFNKYKEAESAFRDALTVFKQTDPNIHPFLTEEWLAYTLIEEHKRKESIELSQQIVAEAKEVDKSHMGNAFHVLSALQLLARAQMADKENANALETYKSLISIMDKQEDKTAPRGYAKIFADMADAENDNSKKLANYSRAISVDPQYARAYQWRAWTFGKMHNTQDELNDLNRAIELDPKDTWSYRRRATLFQDMHEPNKAIADLNRALELDPLDDEARARRGALFEQLKQNEKALEDLNKVIENQTKKGSDAMDSWAIKNALYYRAQIYDSTRKPDLARKDRKTAASISDAP
jgi:tetratricopeptide (TPR) repeat protein